MEWETDLARTTGENITMKNTRIVWIGLIALIPLILVLNCKKPTQSDEATGKLNVTDAWVLETPETQSMTAAFMKISNSASEDDALTSALSDAAEKTEIHEMVMEGEKMIMRPVEKVAIGAGQSVELKRGGLHVMLIGVKKHYKEGDIVHLKLHFEKAGDMEMDLPVKKAEMEEMHHM